MSTKQIRKHGFIRGLSEVPSSSISEGLFGRMFRTLPKANFDESALTLLASAMVAKVEGAPTPEMGVEFLLIFLIIVSLMELYIARCESIY